MYFVFFLSPALFVLLGKVKYFEHFLLYKMRKRSRKALKEREKCKILKIWCHFDVKIVYTNLQNKSSKLEYKIISIFIFVI